MTIFYSVISRGETVLCNNSKGRNKYEETVRSILPNIPTRNDAKTTYTANDCMYHVMVDNGIIYICASDTDSGRRQPFSFLVEIKRQLTTGELSDRLQFASEFELQSDFGPVLASEMERFSSPDGRTDQLNVLQSQVDEVRDVMTQNIENVLKRGENLNTLMDKTEELEASSNTFRKTARRVHRTMWWKNTKMTIIIVVVVLLVILAIVLIILFSTGVLPANKGGVTTTTTTTQQPGP